MTKKSPLDDKKSEVFKYLVAINKKISSDCYTLDTLFGKIKEKAKMERKHPLVKTKSELLEILHSLERDQTIIITEDGELIA